MALADGEAACPSELRSGSSAATRLIASGEATERGDGAGGARGGGEAREATDEAGVDCESSRAASTRWESHESCACRDAAERLLARIGVRPPRSRITVAGSPPSKTSKSGWRRCLIGVDRGGDDAALRSVIVDGLSSADGADGATVGIEGGPRPGVPKPIWRPPRAGRPLARK